MHRGGSGGGILIKQIRSQGSDKIRRLKMTRRSREAGIITVLLIASIVGYKFLATVYI